MVIGLEREGSRLLCINALMPGPFGLPKHMPAIHQQAATIAPPPRDAADNTSHTSPLLYVRFARRPHPAPCLPAQVAAQPGMFPELLRSLFEMVLFEECSNQWSLSRPMLPLLLINSQAFEQIKVGGDQWNGGGGQQWLCVARCGRGCRDEYGVGCSPLARATCMTQWAGSTVLMAGPGIFCLYLVRGGTAAHDACTSPTAPAFNTALPCLLRPPPPPAPRPIHKHILPRPIHALVRPLMVLRRRSSSPPSRPSASPTWRPAWSGSWWRSHPPWSQRTRTASRRCVCLRVRMGNIYMQELALGDGVARDTLMVGCPSLRQARSARCRRTWQ